MQDGVNYNRDIFAANLRALMKKHGEKQNSVAQLLGVSRSSVSAYCGGIQMPRMDKLQKLSGHFGVALRELLENVSDGSAVTAIYSSLNDDGKAELLRYACTLLTLDEYVLPISGEPEYIKHYTVPAAAGYAAPIAGEDYELMMRTELTPGEADFCLTIHGDSMMPYINDGDIVYVRKNASLEEFDVGIFYVDGDVFCKQWCVDYAGTLHLLSANPARQNANIHIPRDTGRKCVCFGKVLLSQRLPRPSYY